MMQERMPACSRLHLSLLTMKSADVSGASPEGRSEILKQLCMLLTIFLLSRVFA